MWHPSITIVHFRTFPSSQRGTFTPELSYPLLPVTPTRICFCLYRLTCLLVFHIENPITCGLLLLAYSSPGCFKPAVVTTTPVLLSLVTLQTPFPVPLQSGVARDRVLAPGVHAQVMRVPFPSLALWKQNQPKHPSPILLFFSHAWAKWGEFPGPRGRWQH